MFSGVAVADLLHYNCETQTQHNEGHTIIRLRDNSTAAQVVGALYDDISITTSGHEALNKEAVLNYPTTTADGGVIFQVYVYRDGSSAKLGNHTDYGGNAHVVYGDNNE